MLQFPVPNEGLFQTLQGKINKDKYLFFTALNNLTYITYICNFRVLLRLWVERGMEGHCQISRDLANFPHREPEKLGRGGGRGREGGGRGEEGAGWLCQKRQLGHGKCILNGATLLLYGFCKYIEKWGLEILF